MRTIIDKELGNDPAVQGLKKFEINEYYREFFNSPGYHEVIDKINNSLSLFDFLKKTTTVKNSISITCLIDLAIKRDYFKFFTTVYPQTDVEVFKKFIPIEKYIYMIKDCIFLVQDLNLLLSNLRKKSYGVNRGPKS